MNQLYQPSRILRFLFHIPNFVRLVWRLLKDPNVRAYKKALPILAAFVSAGYLLFPFDLLPDPYAILGQLDDATVLLLILVPSVWLFVRMCPKELVRKYSREISQGRRQ